VGVISGVSIMGTIVGVQNGGPCWGPIFGVHSGVNSMESGTRRKADVYLSSGKTFVFSG
jgi:hypothetical protein